MSLKKKAVSGISWTFAQQFGTQIISFGVSIILARLLLPSEFGLIAMIGILMGIGNILINGGLTSSLIRIQAPTDADYSTVFYFNLVGSLIIYFIIFFVSPYVAVFYKQPILTSVIRLYSIVLIINAFEAIQLTILTKEMNFKRQMIMQLPALFIGGVFGMILAYFKWGVWSLVWMTIITTSLNTIQLWFSTSWKPSLIFSKERFKYHFHYGYKMTLSGLLNIIFENAYPIIIGKIYSPQQLGFYNRADSLKQLPVANISVALNKVTFPLFATIQNDDAKLKEVYKRILKMVIFIVAPVLMLMLILARPLFIVLFTEKWLPAIPYFQILIISGLLYPIHAYNLNVLEVKGRTDLFLRLEILKKTLFVILICLSLKFGIYGLLWSNVVLSFLALIINTHYSGRFLNYSAFQQIKDIFPAIALTSCVGVLCHFILNLNAIQALPNILILLIIGMLGIICYSGMAVLLKFSAIKELYLLIKR